MRFIKHSTHPGIIASPVSGKPKTASSPEPSKMGNGQDMQAARISVDILELIQMFINLELPHIRRSHDRAISSPPPNAAPSITAIEGTRSAWIKCIQVNNVSVQGKETRLSIHGKKRSGYERHHITSYKELTYIWRNGIKYASRNMSAV